VSSLHAGEEFCMHAKCTVIQEAQNDILVNQQILARNQMKLEETLISVHKKVNEVVAVNTPVVATASVDFHQSNIGGVDSEGKPWSANTDRMASMNKELRKSKACYLCCLSELGFPVEQSEGTLGVSSISNL